MQFLHILRFCLLNKTLEKNNVIETVWGLALRFRVRIPLGTQLLARDIVLLSRECKTLHPRGPTACLNKDLENLHTVEETKARTGFWHQEENESPNNTSPFIHQSSIYAYKV